MDEVVDSDGGDDKACAMRYLVKKNISDTVPTQMQPDNVSMKSTPGL